MTEPKIPNTPQPSEIDAAQAADVGGGNWCSADELRQLTASLKQSYENLVDFASHVIERVSGGSGTL
jgi:hypothetical protein